ncbi:MAG: hypothetical protein IM671_00650 [Phenylobacterium sp.]|uniref:hypothetical protein n=1 Tax=Phenylobacterium sp. TaxID=1871053 RepID=UPI0025D90CB2|nr:hypothetical protein [Phenylobacterium sp.]MCA6243613.1 hypothetical protein [Phenylobacterium sp.]MCA6245211.1 hypothetical protein [Phenylobacterium sp.]MCA6254920.1 hypothetical protein [Phenylobacterium sp.]
MRQIRTKGTQPDEAWLEKAAKLLDKLDKAADKAERDKVIDDNAKLWGDLKKWLLELSHQKCWFSEAKDGFSHFHVEHFRPKKGAKDLDGTVHDAYWWLAFEWTNFRVCGSVGNSKKGIFFPLRDGSARAGPGGDLRFEDAMLLDPMDSHDASLLSFNVEGDAIVAPGVTDDWEVQRVEYSIERMNLTFGPLSAKRKAVWANCWAAIEEYLNELALYHQDKANVIAKSSFKNAMGKLVTMIGEAEEFSSVARACILATGDPRVMSVLQAA